LAQLEAIFRGLRTRAGSALGAEHCANEDAEILGILGYGPIADAHVEATRLVRSSSLRKSCLAAISMSKGELGRGSNAANGQVGPGEIETGVRQDLVEGGKPMTGKTQPQEPLPAHLVRKLVQARIAEN
jgi:hypothetical protein